jgi:hypothetical protein
MILSWARGGRAREGAMKFFGSVIVLGLTTLIALSPVAMNSQTDFHLTHQMISTESRRMKEFHQDFNSITQSNKNDEEIVLTTVAMSNEANRHGDALDYLSAMLEMYETVQSQTDKESIRPIIDPRLRYELESIDLSIKNSNNMIGFTRSPGVATTATNFKEELRKVREMLSRPY